MPEYRVEIDGETVWSTTTDEYEGCFEVFPAEYTDRPESGEVYLIVDGEIIGRQISLAQEAAEAAEAEGA